MSKIAIITGASSGIGRETAGYFSERKWTVLLLGRNLKHLKETQMHLSSPSIIIQLELKSENHIELTIKKIKSILKDSKDVEEITLINCAGIYQPKPHAKNTTQDWTKVFQVNFFGQVQLTNGLVSSLKKIKQASIVNVSSTLGKKGIESAMIYSATKAALNSWTQTLALALGSDHIRVNALCPGIVDTPIHSFHSQDKKSKRKALVSLNKLQPLGRIGTPLDIAKAIHFLACPDSSWTTGALFDIDGGISLT